MNQDNNNDFNTLINPYRVCEGCICELLKDKDIIISNNIFHNNICAIHYKYLKQKENKNEKELYDKTGRNFFVDLVEYNIHKMKIRDVTICFLVEYLNKYFFN